MGNSSQLVFKKSLQFSALLVMGVLVVGSIIGLLVGGSDGFATAIVGTLLAFIFTGLTAVSIWLGAKLPLTGFYGLVLGCWLVKLVLFAIGLGALQSAEFVHGPTLFFTIVGTVLGGLAIDSWVVLRTKVATIS
ncbi:MAG: hypothetical protein RL752_39 [Actinomycetota bacterium]